MEIMENFMESYNEESDERSNLKGNIQYPEILHDLHNNLPFLPEIWKKLKDLYPTCMINKVNTHKNFKTSTKLWISIE